MLAFSDVINLVLSNGPEILGTLTGVVGALMLAIKNRFSPWAWPVWMVSNIAWIVWALSAHAYGTLIQQLVFLVINCVGTWHWLAAVQRQGGEVSQPQTLKRVWNRISTSVSAGEALSGRS